MLFAPLLAWRAAFGSPSSYRKVFLIAAFLAVVFALLSGSRAVVLATMIGMTPILFAILRSRVLAATTTLLAVGLGWALSASRELVSVDRFLSLQSGRLDIASDYLDEIAQRFVFGLLFTNGKGSLPSAEVGWSAHNSYLHWLYIGGVILAVPLVLLGVATLVGASAMSRHGDDRSRLLYRVLTFALLGSYMAALTNGMLLYPTNACGLQRPTPIRCRPRSGFRRRARESTCNARC